MNNHTTIYTTLLKRSCDIIVYDKPIPTVVRFYTWSDKRTATLVWYLPYIIMRCNFLAKLAFKPRMNWFNFIFKVWSLYKEHIKNPFFDLFTVSALTKKKIFNFNFPSYLQSYSYFFKDMSIINYVIWCQDDVKVISFENVTKTSNDFVVSPATKAADGETLVDTILLLASSTSALTTG